MGSHQASSNVLFTRSKKLGVSRLAARSPRCSRLVIIFYPSAVYYILLNKINYSLVAWHDEYTGCCYRIWRTVSSVSVFDKNGSSQYKLRLTKTFLESTILRLAMVEWDWRLRTAASTGLFFISGWFAMWTMVWWYWLWLTPNLCTRALWQPQYCPTVLSAETSLERMREWAKEMRI
jgi:hypothetical protein